jgi:hypothetical protein
MSVGDEGYLHIWVTVEARKNGLSLARWPCQRDDQADNQYNKLDPSNATTVAFSPRS